MSVPWIRWTDPYERAFSLEVPETWKISGGLFRRSPMQPHFLVAIHSPSGRSKMLLGNSEGFLYSVPTLRSYQLGFHEEMLYSPGGDHLWIRSYRTGRVFAEVYGLHVLRTECTNVTLLGSRDRPEIGRQTINQMGLPETVTAGEAFFTCEKDGKKYEAYMYSQTEMSGVPQMSELWGADNSWGFLVPAGSGMAAGAMLSRIIGTIQTNQNWLAQQLKVSWQMANANMQASIQASEAQSRAMQATFAAMDRRSAERHAEVQHEAANAQAEIGRIVSGFDTYSTSTGERKTVPYGAATNWWSNNLGQTLGTLSNMSPGYQWTPMTRVPLDQ